MKKIVQLVFLITSISSTVSYCWEWPHRWLEQRLTIATLKPFSLFIGGFGSGKLRPETAEILKKDYIESRDFAIQRANTVTIPEWERKMLIKDAKWWGMMVKSVERYENLPTTKLRLYMIKLGKSVKSSLKSIKPRL